jgi:penicillin-binding protein 1C
VKRRACLLLALVLALALGWGALRVLRHAAGEPSALLGDRWYEGVEVTDRSGLSLQEIPSEKGLRGRETTLDAMGSRIVLATLAAEDHGFFLHDGVDTEAVVRAGLTDVLHGKLVSGGSTITEQLVKLLDQEGEPRKRSLRVKLVEMARAENLEEHEDKHGILEAYMNRLPYGHTMTGPEAAARGYFGVAAKDLSWAEAAFLAVVPRAPSALDPITHVSRVVPRQRLVLAALRERGFLSDEDLARAEAEVIEPRRPSRAMLAPYLVDALHKEGLLVAHGTTKTTIDLPLQKDVEGLARTHLAAVRGFGATDAAVIVVDNASGDVLAYVGGADYDDPVAGKVDMARARRQPGSTLKPFVYALAFEHGHTSSDMIADVPTSFPSETGTYSPSNFDGTFEGPVSLREALAGSLNVPAIRLAAELPRGAMLDRLHALGFELPEDERHYGLSLVLGSGEVTLRELAGAYATLARGGERVELRETYLTPRAPLAALQRGGSVNGIIDASAAALVADALSDPLARVRGLHGRGPFDIGFPVAAKTGTSSGYRDAWTAGFTHERTVAVWVGNADGAPMRGLAGAGGAGPLFADVMRRAMQDVTTRAPLWDPTLLVTRDVCPLSGHLAGAACPDHAERLFAKAHAPASHCDLHVRASPRLARAGEAAVRCDEAGARTVVVLPAAFDSWLAGQPLGTVEHDVLGLPWFPRARVPGCEEAGQERSLKVLAPADGSVIVLSRFRPEAESVELRASAAGQGIGVVEFLVDGVVVGQVDSGPLRVVTPARPGDHVVEVRPRDPRAEVALGTSRFSVR